MNLENGIIAFAILAALALFLWLMPRSTWQKFDDGKDEDYLPLKGASDPDKDMQDPDSWGV